MTRINFRKCTAAVLILSMIGIMTAFTANGKNVEDASSDVAKWISELGI